MLLVVNAGSATLKCAGFAADAAAGDSAPRLLFRALVDGIGAGAHLAVRAADGAVLAERRWPAAARVSHAEALAVLRDGFAGFAGGRAVRAVGHRVVHGGVRFAAPVRIDADVLHELDALVPLAPLHQPHNLALVHAFAQHEPELPQVACFDTAFHRTLPEVAQRFALPRALHDAGIRRYGFHGLSCEFIARRLPALDPAAAAGRVVVAHLGAGASMTALRAGRSVDTTMGFTALDGLPMGTRCGALDPGVMLHLLAGRHATVDELTRLLYQQSGLLGVSGLSADMRTLLASDDPHAREAVDLFVHRAVREFGALVAVLGGLDALVFTAGIGEHAPAIRQAICERAGALGLQLDALANEANATRVSAPASAARIYVVPTDEERMIAMHTQAVLGGGGRTA
jgi:acetate kinase